MSFFKRIKTTLYGHLDQTINQIENQDAVIDAIVREARQEVAKAKVRLARVEADAQKMAAQSQQLQQQIASWTARAQRTGHVEQDRALECLRQRKGCEKQLADLQHRMSEHEAVRQRLAVDVRTAEARVTEILNKQHLMRTRESAANAMRGVNSLQGDLSLDLNDTFDRWEVKVTESELMAGNDASLSGEDSFEQVFISEEEESVLRAELAALTQGVDEKAAYDGKGEEQAIDVKGDHHNV